MAEKELFIIRHGETDYNKKNIIQGRGIDAPLNKKGEEQAQLFYRKYKDIPFEIVFYSSLLRTRQTVHPFIEAGLMHRSFSELNEINWGAYEGRDPKDCNGEYEKIYHEWRKGNLYHKAPEGECPVEVQQRQKLFLDYLQEAEYRTILICMHGRAMRILLSTITGKPLSAMDDFPHQNLSLYKVCLRAQNFEVELFNNTEHLANQS